MLNVDARPSFLETFSNVRAAIDTDPDDNPLIVVHHLQARGPLQTRISFPQPHPGISNLGRIFDPKMLEEIYRVGNPMNLGEPIIVRGTDIPDRAGEFVETLTSSTILRIQPIIIPAYDGGYMEGVGLTIKYGLPRNPKAATVLTGALEGIDLLITAMREGVLFEPDRVDVGLLESLPDESPLFLDDSRYRFGSKSFSLHFKRIQNVRKYLTLAQEYVTSDTLSLV